MKRAIATVLSLALLLAALSGCGSKNPSPTQSTPAPGSGTPSSSSTSSSPSDGVDWSSKEAVTIRIGHTNSETDSRHTMLLKFKDLMNERTGGKVTVDVYGGGTLGTAREMVEGLQVGMLEVVVEGYYGFNSVVATGHTVERTVERLKDSPVHTLFGFGDAGRFALDGKIPVLKRVLDLGVEEVDFIMNMPRFLEGEYAVVQDEISTLTKICGQYQVGLKVIIESGLLTDQQKLTAVELAIAGGAEYIKTASGSNGSGTINMHNILLLKKAIAGRAKLKASSGIQTLEDAMVYMEAGADRTAGRDNMIAQLQAIGYQP